MNNCKSFNPSIDNNSKILILGSMPEVKSLDEQQYYANKPNVYSSFGLIFIVDKNLSFLKGFSH